MQPSDLPVGLLRDGAETEPCAICTCALLGDSGDGSVSALAIRQLPCSHAFHARCVDIWLTEQAGVCPLCLAAYPRPPSESQPLRSKSAYENYQRRMANGGRELLEQQAREEEARFEELNRRDQEQRTVSSHIVVGMM